MDQLLALFLDINSMLFYFHYNDTGSMSGGRETARGAGVDEMVGTGRTGTRAGKDVDVY